MDQLCGLPWFRIETSPKPWVYKANPATWNKNKPLFWFKIRTSKLSKLAFFPLKRRFRTRSPASRWTHAWSCNLDLETILVVGLASGIGRKCGISTHFKQKTRGIVDLGTIFWCSVWGCGDISPPNLGFKQEKLRHHMERWLDAFFFGGQWSAHGYYMYI